jgi:signal peptidase II
MTGSRRAIIILFLLIAGLTVCADQITKHLVNTRVPLGGAIEIVPGVANLVHARNPGAAFGFLAGSQWQFRSLFFIAISVAALAFLLGFMIFSKDVDGYLVLGYAFFFGGALGNLIDRVRVGEVTDFLDMYWRGYHWPAFNVADSALCLGAFFIFIHFLRLRRTETAPTR